MMMATHFLDHHVLAYSYSEERPRLKLCPRNVLFPYCLPGDVDNSHDYPSETCMNCTEYPLAVAARRVRAFPSFRDAMADVFQRTSRCESGPVCRRNLCCYCWFVFCMPTHGFTLEPVTHSTQR
jgi:hypothetical protein